MNLDIRRFAVSEPPLSAAATTPPPSLPGGWDVAVVGAGVSGLTCARQLAQAGQRVVLLDKSRGLGGRLATRRLHGMGADHGLSRLPIAGDRPPDWITELLDANVIQPDPGPVGCVTATGVVPEPTSLTYYIAPAGMTAIAKFWAADLPILRQHRVVQLIPQGDRWHLHSDTPESHAPPISARQVVLAIPAPQAIALLQPLDLPAAALHSLRSVEFAPCLSVMAVYPAACQSAWAKTWPDYSALRLTNNPTLAWLSLENHKRPHPEQTVVVLQSTADLARQYLAATDLQPAGNDLLTAAASLAPWLAQPTTVQVHRWRYAVPIAPLAQDVFTVPTQPPLFCVGDWCRGPTVMDAWATGQAIATQLLHSIEQDR